MGNVQNQQVHIGGRDVILGEQLGEGGFAFVYSVSDVQTGTKFALKRMLAQDQENKLLAEKEIKVLVRRHTNMNEWGKCGLFLWRELGQDRSLLIFTRISFLSLLLSFLLSLVFLCVSLCMCV